MTKHFGLKIFYFIGSFPTCLDLYFSFTFCESTSGTGTVHCTRIGVQRPCHIIYTSTLDKVLYTCTTTIVPSTLYLYWSTCKRAVQNHSISSPPFRRLKTRYEKRRSSIFLDILALSSHLVLVRTSIVHITLVVPSNYAYPRCIGRVSFCNSTRTIVEHFTTTRTATTTTA